MDWRKKVREILQEARGISTMEKNESNLFADMMKRQRDELDNKRFTANGEGDRVIPQ